METKIEHWVCVKEHPKMGHWNFTHPGIIWPQVGTVYTIREVLTLNFRAPSIGRAGPEIMVLLNEIVNTIRVPVDRSMLLSEPCWFFDHFRLLKPIKIEVTRSIKIPEDA